MTETVRSRFKKVMSGTLPDDRLPMLEWAEWWDLTIRRWESEGLPAGLNTLEIRRYFAQDMHCQFWIGAMGPGLTPKHTGHGAPFIDDAEDYASILPCLYPRTLSTDREAIRRAAQAQAEGSSLVWITLDGFFWWPRILFGIEPHLYAFYDQPELMHRINQHLAEYNLRMIEQFSELCVPDFATIAEDMSYNHGPMISKELFDEFMAPYYRQVIPALTSRGIIPIIDSDGDIEPLIPWFEAVGLEGILPLERMAGVDVNRIRANHPRWKMIGGFDKTVMHLGEARMRAEFERLLPAMRSGYFIPSVDHQTPPGVSLENYRLYMQLLQEYTERACARA